MTESKDSAPDSAPTTTVESPPSIPPPPLQTAPSPQRQKQKRPRGRPATEISRDDREEIVRLSKFYKSRAIARRMDLGRKVIERVLEEEGIRAALEGPRLMTAGGASKLDAYLPSIEALVRKDLTITRILREIEELGYQGGRTILSEHVRELRARLTLPPRTPPVKRRFETDAGVEMQIDWSPYLIPIGGRMVQVHALGCLLAFSRKLYLRFYRDERQATLLEGLASAFHYFQGVAHRLVLDNMATAVLGRIGHDAKPLWHPRFLEFVAYYGCHPFACRVKDPDRKGKKEKSFRLVWDDFLKGVDFASWEDLDERRRVWLDETPEVGNLRVHGTTRRVPNEAWAEEQPLLIQLPGERFSVHEEAARIVDRDATLSIRGTRYTVPAHLAARSVAVRLYAEHFEVLDPHGRVAFSRAYARDDQKGKLIIDPTHYASLPRRGPAGGSGAGCDRLDEAFVRRFPTLAPLADGLKLRMKTLAHVHFRALLRSCERYGQQAFLAAATRAQEYRRFDAGAVERILERTHPLPDGDQVAPLSGLGPTVLGEVEPPSFDGYAHLDRDVVDPLPTTTSAATTATQDKDNGS
jgi:transposase